MDLTKEYFDQQLATQLAAQTKELKDYVRESFEVQQHYIDHASLKLLGV